MQSDNLTRTPPKRTPWNKGKLTGPKPPLRTKYVWSIRTKLQVEGRVRDLAMFNLAIDSKLRACDVVRIKVEDVSPHGRALNRVTVRQKKTVRTDRPDTSVDRRIHQGNLQEVGRFPIRKSSERRSGYFDASVRSDRVYLDSRDWSRTKPIRDAFPSPNQGDPHLSPHR
jgi:hypothetical protein